MQIEHDDDDVHLFYFKILAKKTGNNYADKEHHGEGCHTANHKGNWAVL